LFTHKCRRPATSGGELTASTGQIAAAITTCVAAATLTPDRIGRIKLALEAVDGEAAEAAATLDEPGGAAAAAAAAEEETTVFLLGQKRLMPPSSSQS
jgi:hypothetical protein